MKLVKVLIIGMVISLIGSLPLGSLNVAALKVYLEQGLYNAILFSVGVAIVEVVYVRISLEAMKWILANKKWFKIMEWVTVVIFIGLALYTFLSNTNQSSATGFKAVSEAPVIDIKWFFLGLFLCAINPVQIPFWFLWSTYLVSSKKLEPKREQYNFYCIGIGIGTLLGEGIYMFGGDFLVQKVGANQAQINNFVAVVFLITAALQLYKLLFKKDQFDDPKLTKNIDNSL
jgi:threonine/homoserine/homoserine lactone efflux protein